MTTAREVIRLVLRSIDTDIDLTKKSLEFAQALKLKNREEKINALESGVDYILASEKYDVSIGFY